MSYPKPFLPTKKRRRFFNTILAGGLATTLGTLGFAHAGDKRGRRKKPINSSTNALADFDYEGCRSAAYQNYLLSCAGVRRSKSGKVWKTTVGYPGCMSDYVAELSICTAKQVGEVVIDTGTWVVDHPGLVIGTIVVIGGVAFIVSTGGAGAVVLIAL